uniref:Phospholipid scramblase n=1 Tax=Strigamia maritima TaxID=126957 RepID=T1IP03_STRMM
MAFLMVFDPFYPAPWSDSPLSGMPLKAGAANVPTGRSAHRTKRICPDGRADLDRTGLGQVFGVQRADWTLCAPDTFPGPANKLEVPAPVGEVIGYVFENSTFCSGRSSFTIENTDGEAIFAIKGPGSCAGGCMGGWGEVDFDMWAFDGSIVGNIQKQSGGLVKETYTNADDFVISFPMNLDVRMKAVVMGACFLIFFEYTQQDHSDRDRSLDIRMHYTCAVCIKIRTCALFCNLKRARHPSCFSSARCIFGRHIIFNSLFYSVMTVCDFPYETENQI